VSRSRREAVTVLEIVPGSGAEKAGLAIGDVILQANGKTNPGDIRRALEQAGPAEELKLRVRSITGEREVHWKLASKEQVELELKDIDNVSQAQRDRRAAWLKGESQAGGQP
jgi:S1-C subfamily serine protease